MTTYTLGSCLHYLRKALVNVVGLAGALLAEGLVPKPYDHYVSLSIAAVTVVLHYQVSNGSAPGELPADDPPADDDEDVYVPTGASEDDLAGVDPAPVADDAPAGPDDEVTTLARRLVDDLVALLGLTAPQPAGPARPVLAAVDGASAAG